MERMAARLSVHDQNHMVIYVANLLADFQRKYSKASKAGSHAKHETKKLQCLDNRSKKILEKAESVSPPPHPRITVSDD